MEPSPSVQQSLENAFLLELNNLASGLDLRPFVPKLALAALQVVEELQEPALYQFVEMLVGFREGKLTASDLPTLVPKTMTAIGELPADIQSKAVARLRHLAAKAVESQRVENKELQSQGVEVHCGVTCDKCDKSPIIGARYKSLEREDYDLCDSCYSHPERMPEQFVRVKSSVIGDVVSSYYAPVAGHGRPVHNGVECDGCQMSPIVGRRFTKIGHDYDLCGACYESSLAKQGDWQEVTIPSDSHLVPLSTVAKAKTQVGCVDAGEDVIAAGDVHMDGADSAKALRSTPGLATVALKKLPEVLDDDEICAELMASLALHPKEAIRSAVYFALQQASGNHAALPQEPGAAVAETQAPQLASLQDLCSTSTPASSSPFDRLGLMLTQVPMEVPVQAPVLSKEGKEESIVSPADDMQTDKVLKEDSEDVGIRGPEQMIDETGQALNAIVTRTDAVEDWLLL